MKGFIWVIVILAIWLIVNTYILPRLGVDT